MTIGHGGCGVVAVLDNEARLNMVDMLDSVDIADIVDMVQKYCLE